MHLLHVYIHTIVACLGRLEIADVRQDEWVSRPMRRWVADFLGTYMRAAAGWRMCKVIGGMGAVPSNRAVGASGRLPVSR